MTEDADAIRSGHDDDPGVAPPDASPPDVPRADAAREDAARADAAREDAAREDAAREDAARDDTRFEAEAGEAESAYELLQRGHDLLHRRHHAQAAVVLERAARLEPGKASILEALGRAYYNSAQHERSRDTFEAMLEIDPSAHYAHFALGQSLKRLGRTREARTHLRLAVALSPSTAMYRSALARMPETDAD